MKITRDSEEVTENDLDQITRKVGVIVGIFALFGHQLLNGTDWSVIGTLPVKRRHYELFDMLPFCYTAYFCSG